MRPLFAIVIAWVVIAPPTFAQPASRPPRVGVLVVAHGGNNRWDGLVRKAVAQARLDVPVQVAFGMGMHQAEGRAFQDAVETTHMIDDDKKAFLNAMDRLATDCLNQEKVIESLDDKKDSLRVRAERLVKFCGSGILREDGRALTLARSQVLNYLRQPNFIQEFTAGISDPKQAEAHIKAFYILLSQSGFKT